MQSVAEGSTPRLGAAWRSAQQSGTVRCCAARPAWCRAVRHGAVLISCLFFPTQFGARFHLDEHVLPGRGREDGRVASVSAVHPEAFGPGCGPCPGLVRGRGAVVSGISCGTSFAGELAPWPAGCRAGVWCLALAGTRSTRKNLPESVRAGGPEGRGAGGPEGRGAVLTWRPGRLGCGGWHYPLHDRLERTFESVRAGWPVLTDFDINLGIFPSEAGGVVA